MSRFMPTLPTRIWHVTVVVTHNTDDDQQRTFDFINDADAAAFVNACSERRLRTNVTCSTVSTFSRADQWVDRQLNRKD